MGEESRSYATMADVVAHAIAFERDSADFYGRLLERDAPPEVRELLDQLRGEELLHAAMLSEVAVSASDARVQFPPEYRLGPFRMPAAELDLDGLLDIAIDRERESAALYRDTAALASGELRRLMEDLARFEEAHERRLRQFRLR